ENLSGGMKQKLALISLLMYAPPFLILDEPTTGVDPMARAELWEMLAQMQSEGRTILVSTPYMEEAVQCDEVIFLSHGKILAMNSPDGLKREYQHRLFELRTANIMTALNRLETERWIHMIYPKGDRLHVSSRETELAVHDVRLKLESLLGESIEIQEISPGMEDVFAALEETA
ncbi:MAG TPA: AAA family ATPase, partial [bacterium]|nr:AAA family ATPase [bacterium]